MASGDKYRPGRVCPACRAAISPHAERCWLCQLKSDPQAASAAKETRPALEPIPKLLVQITAICILTLGLMIGVGQQFLSYAAAVGLAGLFIASWQFVGWSHPHEQASDQVVRRFIASLLLTFGILVALPAAAIIALFVICVGALTVAGVIQSIP